ncbi:MAG: leucine-rich repeat domain-containing protein [Candidatus Limisoma sp.]
MLLISAAATWAYDFKVDGIYYKDNKDGKTVAVAKESMMGTAYVGDVVIPSEVTYNGTTYSVTSIDEEAFFRCSGMTSVTIPNSITSIGDSAFYGCSGLTSLTVPESVTELGVCAFQDCTGLTSMTIPDSITMIPNGTFWYCIGLTSVTIPDSVTLIDASAFAFCSGLTSFTIPEAVTELREGAFMMCTGLTSITIPEAVNSIGNYAFGGCSSLMTFTSKNTTPPTLTSVDTFKEMSEECQLYVPESSIEAYKTALGWTFFTLVDAIKDGDVKAVNSDSLKVTVADGAIRISGAVGAVAEVYSLSGALLYRGTDATIAMPRGMYVVKVAGTTAKVML